MIISPNVCAGCGRWLATLVDASTRPRYCRVCYVASVRPKRLRCVECGDELGGLGVRAHQPSRLRARKKPLRCHVCTARLNGSKGTHEISPAMRAAAVVAIQALALARAPEREAKEERLRSNPCSVCGRSLPRLTTRRTNKLPKSRRCRSCFMRSNRNAVGRGQPRPA